MSDSDVDSMLEQEERREESRITRAAILYVETVSALPDSDEGPEIIACDTLDYSANGIQVAMDKELTAGAIHQMSLQLPSNNEQFQLTGEVRWVRWDDVSSRYLAGIRLYDSEGTEIIDWKLAIANWMHDTFI